MNPDDVAQSALPLDLPTCRSSACSGRRIVVKVVMIGLLVCSVWVWAIVIDKILLYARTRRAMDRFEQAFWSGQSLEELYRTLSARPTPFDGGAVRRRHARMEAQLRRLTRARSPACRCASRR